MKINHSKGLSARAVVFCAITAALMLHATGPALAKLPGDAAKPLNELAARNLPVVSALANDLKKRFDKVTAKSGANVLKDATIKGVRGTFVIFKPANTQKFMFAASFRNLSLSKLVNGSFLDGVAPKDMLLVVATPDLSGTLQVSAWPQELRQMKPAPKTLNILPGLNVFIPLNGVGPASEALKILKAAGLNIKNLMAELRVSETKEISATAVVAGDWKKPFGLRNTVFRNVSLKLAKSTSKDKGVTITKRTMQAWGDIQLKGKSYFLWGSQSNQMLTPPPPTPPVPSRAFGLAAKDISMATLMDFADALPIPGVKNLGARVNQNLPTDKIIITNSRYAKPAKGAIPKPESFMVLYAEPGEAVANTGKAGPIFYASGAAKILGWDAAFLRADIDPMGLKVKVDGNMKSPPAGGLPFSAGSKVKIDVNALQKKFLMNFSGAYKIADVTVAGASFNVSKSSIKGTVDLGCIPPMLKASLNARFSGKLPAPKVGPSGCLDTIGKGVEEAAKKTGHAVTGAANEVGNAMESFGKAVSKSTKGPTRNKDLSLTSVAIIHKTLTNTLSDMKRTSTPKVNLTKIILKGKRFPGLPNVTVTQKQLTGMIDRLSCTIEGRMFYLVTLEKVARQLTQKKKVDKLMAEATFYPPFQGTYKAVKAAKPNTKGYLKLRACAEMKPRLI